jgi:hypothetical protein
MRARSPSRSASAFAQLCAALLAGLATGQADLSVGGSVYQRLDSSAFVTTSWAPPPGGCSATVWLSGGGGGGVGQAGGGGASFNVSFWLPGSAVLAAQGANGGSINGAGGGASALLLGDGAVVAVAGGGGGGAYACGGRAGPPNWGSLANASGLPGCVGTANQNTGGRGGNATAPGAAGTTTETSCNSAQPGSGRNGGRGGICTYNGLYQVSSGGAGYGTGGDTESWLGYDGGGGGGGWRGGGGGACEWPRACAAARARACAPSSPPFARCLSFPANLQTATRTIPRAAAAAAPLSTRAS